MEEPGAPGPPPSFALRDGDKAADDRDRLSKAHDVAAAERDDRSEARDARAELREQQDGPTDAAAAADRDGARQDRAGSAADRSHSEDDRDAASADRVRAAVERANLVVDGLTGAHQRAPGLVELEREVLKARRTKQPFVLAFLDVDGLKATNDTRGHAAGDQQLVELAAAVRSVIREYDLVIRYGGDEFLCGLSNVALDAAADRFAGATGGRTRLGVAFSFGLAELRSGDTVQDLIDRADAAMYEQRASRRR